MNELKAHKAYNRWIDDEMPTPNDDLICNEVYLKSEADKYINLLKDKANYNEYAYKHKSEELADTCRFYEDELRQHKHKRCLAIAMWCAADCVVNQNTYKKYLTHKSEFRITHFRKWYFRWLELAEKFKDKETK